MHSKCLYLLPLNFCPCGSSCLLRDPSGVGWCRVHPETFCWTQTSQVPNSQGCVGAIQELSWTWFSLLKPAEPLASLPTEAALLSAASTALWWLVVCSDHWFLDPRSPRAQDLVFALLNGLGGPLLLLQNAAAGSAPASARQDLLS